jgi:hypothetical protein
MYTGAEIAEVELADTIGIPGLPLGLEGIVLGRDSLE